MKREDIAKIFEGATDEQMKALLDLNSADITHALNKQKGELDTARSDLENTRRTLKELQDSAADMDDVRARLKTFEDAEKTRLEKEKADAERARLISRMDAVLGDRKFAHEKLRDPVADEFARAISDQANVGKSDKEIFEAITDGQNYFASQNPPAPNMPGFGGYTGGDSHMAAMRAAMGLPDDKK